MVAKEKVQQAELLGRLHAAFGHDLQRGCRSQRVHRKIRVDIGCHTGSKAHKQHNAGDQRRIGEVIAKAAVQLFDHNDGDKRADDADPQRHAGRHIERQNHTGYTGRKIPHRIGLFPQQAVQIFKRNAGQHGDSHRDQRAVAKDQPRCNNAGRQPDKHRAHQPTGGGGVPDMGRGCDKQRLIHYLPPLRCSRRYQFFASVTVWETGRLAGQT